MSANDPFAALGKFADDTARDWREWRARPLAEKSAIRAGRGTAVLTFCGYVAAADGATAAPLLIVPALLGLLWVCAGVAGARGSPRDVVSGFWWGVGALFCAGLLLAQAHPAASGSTGTVWLCGVYLAALSWTVMRCWLALRPMPQTKLPHPSKVKGAPMAGPASAAAAHAAINRRRRGRRWWQFWM
jgi:hypothetical protein